MAAPSVAKNKPQIASEVCRRYVPSAHARGLLRKGLSPQAFIDALLEHELHADAVTFVAHWLSKEEAVWWGCLCAWQVHRERPSPAMNRALQATIQWLQEPTEARRRSAEAAAAAAGSDNAPGPIALAAVWARGSMSAAGLPEVSPPESLTAETIAAAVRLAAAHASGEPGNAYRQFVHLGCEVAAGKNRWRAE